MLILTRTVGQDVCIGDGIIVRVLRVNGRRVRLGLIAAAEIPIVRAELERFQPVEIVGHVDDTMLEED